MQKEALGPWYILLPETGEHITRDRVMKLQSAKPTRVRDAQIPQQHLPDTEGSGSSKV